MQAPDWNLCRLQTQCEPSEGMPASSPPRKHASRPRPSRTGEPKATFPPLLPRRLHFSVTGTVHAENTPAHQQSTTKTFPGNRCRFSLFGKGVSALLTPGWPFCSENSRTFSAIPPAVGCEHFDECEELTKPLFFLKSNLHHFSSLCQKWSDQSPTGI